jgi:hypothetical protein
MSTFVAAGPLTRISAPLPPPRRFTLLDAANLVVPENDRWVAGASIEDYPPGPAYLHDGCSTGTFRAKSEGGDFHNPSVNPFTVYVPAKCTARSIGAVPDRFKDRLELILLALEAAAVEEMLIGGSGFADQYVGDANMEILGGGAVDPIEGLALLEDEIASVGAGIIHVAPATATYWAGEGLIEAVRNQMQTKLGTPVAIGAGYRDADPDSGASPAADEEWAFATGPIEILRDQTPRYEASEYSQALDRSSNEVVFIVERDYLLSWVGRSDGSDEAHIQAGVLIDRLP